MNRFVRVCLPAHVLAVLIAAQPFPAYPGEAVHPEGRDARRIETDQRRADDKKIEEKRDGTEAGYRKALEGKDFSHVQKGETPSPGELLQESKAGKNADAEVSSVTKEAREKQLDHAWEGHAKEFQKIGIGDKEGLADHISDVRENHDVHESLPRGRDIYGKIDNGKEGTIVVDNPSAENGGTAFRNKDINRYIQKEVDKK